MVLTKVSNRILNKQMRARLDIYKLTGSTTKQAVSALATSNERSKQWRIKDMKLKFQSDNCSIDIKRQRISRFNFFPICLILLQGQAVWIPRGSKPVCDIRKSDTKENKLFLTNADTSECYKDKIFH